MVTLDRDTTRPIGPRGKVWLVGAGPGDPELLTVRAVRLVARARVLAYDELVSPEILALAPADAERIPVGRRAGRHVCGSAAAWPVSGACRHHEARIHPLVIVRALEGREVVRLKGGDPFVFGRGGEEAEELAAARVPFEVVPGISAALGAAAATHVPLTHRECASSVTFATAHAASGDGAPDFAGTVPRDGTVVLYMGLGRLAETCAELVAHGRSAQTPVAVVSRATLRDQRTVRGTLADIAERVSAADLPAPALVIVGDVVARAVASPPAMERRLPLRAWATAARR
jgi:uroporphyrin-III C-methyltransferase